MMHNTAAEHVDHDFQCSRRKTNVRSVRASASREVITFDVLNP